jgi:hypothetical protein
MATKRSRKVVQMLPIVRVTIEVARLIVEIVKQLV